MTTSSTPDLNFHSSKKACNYCSLCGDPPHPCDLCSDLCSRFRSGRHTRLARSQYGFLDEIATLFCMSFHWDSYIFNDLFEFLTFLTSLSSHQPYSLCCFSLSSASHSPCCFSLFRLYPLASVNQLPPICISLAFHSSSNFCSLSLLIVNLARGLS